MPGTVDAAVTAPSPVITHAVNKSGGEGGRRKVRVLGGALRLRVPGHVPAHVRER